VYTSSTAGVLIRIVGAAPPNVHTYCAGSGLNVITERSLTGRVLLDGVQVDEADVVDPAGIRPAAMAS
jgi:hypothetical protein